VILSIVSGLLIWLILRRMSTRFRNKVLVFYILIIIPIAIISFISTFPRIGGYYRFSIFNCNFNIPLSYPLEITYCKTFGLSFPTTFDYYIKFFGYRIYLFDIVMYESWPFLLAAFLLGFLLFVINYLSTCLILFCIKKIVPYIVEIKNKKISA